VCATRESGEIGKPSLMHIVSRDPALRPSAISAPPADCFLTLTIHDFDMAASSWATNEEIYTSAGVMVDPESARPAILDTALILMRFRNGVIATIDNSAKAVYGYDQRVEILGSAGKIEIAIAIPTRPLSAMEARAQRSSSQLFMTYTESFALELKSLRKPCLKASQRW